MSLIFTDRQLDVLACLIRGKPTKNIAQILNIKNTTVETHKRDVMNKLGVNAKERVIDWIEKNKALHLELIERYISLTQGSVRKEDVEDVLRPFLNMHPAIPGGYRDYPCSSGRRFALQYLFDLSAEELLEFNFAEKIYNNFLRSNEFRCLTKFEKTEKIYNLCLYSFEKHYGDQHVEYARVLRDFGHLYFLNNNFTVAELMLQKSLLILKKNRSQEIKLCYEYLRNLYENNEKLEELQGMYMEEYQFYLKHSFKYPVHLKTKIPLKLRFFIWIKSFQLD